MKQINIYINGHVTFLISLPKKKENENPPALNHSIHTSRANKTKSEDLLPMVMAGWPSLRSGVCIYFV